SNKALEESLSTGYFGCVLILGIQTLSFKFTNHTVGIPPTSPLSSSVSLPEMRRAHDCLSWGKRKRQEAENIKLIQNKQYGRADDEYDFEDGPCRKSTKKVATQQDSSRKTSMNSLTTGTFSMLTPSTDVSLTNAKYPARCTKGRFRTTFPAAWSVGRRLRGIGAPQVEGQVWRMRRRERREKMGEKEGVSSARAEEEENGNGRSNSTDTKTQKWPEPSQMACTSSIGIPPTSSLSSSVLLPEMRRAHDCLSWGKRKRQEAENIKLIQNKQYGRADDEYDFEDGPCRKSRKKVATQQERCLFCFENPNQPKHLVVQEAENIKLIQNKQYGRADDEYDFEDGPCRKSRKKVATQQERCLFCFENPNQPKHLVVSIANFTYLMLPRWQPVVPGHCFILPMQHESATRSVDNYVWEEIRNFKKCLIMMFAKQGKDLVFLETVMGLAQQRRHCLIECIPLPQKIAKQAPLYFKKAIEEAEHEWSQHNAKKLIDTSLKGLRGSVPKDFPYFHVEFGLNSGFVHVMDDERQFKSTFGLDVIRGMLRLPEEEVYRRRRHESVDAKKQAVANFARDWEPFDWTKQLN
ncbi:hypothetical protein P3X46_035302, partial [Hevea brasiliensis]